MITPPVLQVETPDPNGTFNLDLDAEGIFGLGPDRDGKFTVKGHRIPDATLVLQEAVTPDFADAVVIATTTRPALTIWGRSPGRYYYRVKAVTGKTSSDWSQGVAVMVTVPNQLELKDLAQYDPRDLLEVQRALLRMCAG